MSYIIKLINEEEVTCKDYDVVGEFITWRNEKHNEINIPISSILFIKEV